MDSAASILPRNQIALVAGAVAFREDLGGIFCAAIGLDLASVDAAPFDEFVRVYDDLFAKCALCLEALNGGVHPFQPVVVVGLEIGIDGKPARPILFAHPRDGNSDHLRHFEQVSIGQVDGDLRAAADCESAAARTESSALEVNLRVHHPVISTSSE